VQKIKRDFEVIYNDCNTDIKEKNMNFWIDEKKRSEFLDKFLKEIYDSFDLIKKNYSFTWFKNKILKNSLEKKINEYIQLKQNLLTYSF